MYKYRDFAGGPALKTLPSNAGGKDSIPDWGAGIPLSQKPKHKTETIL